MRRCRSAIQGVERRSGLGHINRVAHDLDLPVGCIECFRGLSSVTTLSLTNNKTYKTSYRRIQTSQYPGTSSPILLRGSSYADLGGGR
jgi:hypothetical protein